MIKDERIEVMDPSDLKRLGEQHSSEMAVLEGMTGKPWMIEVEVLADPTDPERFLRFGTDTTLMRSPGLVPPWR